MTPADLVFVDVKRYACKMREVDSRTLIDADNFRQLALQRLLQIPIDDPTHSDAASDFDLNPDRALDALEPQTNATLTKAAVLIPIMARELLTVLLTERTAHLTAHPGQIAFPGGKIELSDAGPLDAAMREVHEEIGLPASYIEVLGFLPPYSTGTGFHITPVVALVKPDFVLNPDPTEVADTFEVPLAFLLDVNNHRIDSRIWRGRERHFYAMPYEHRYIWGATAGMIRSLQRRLFEV